MLLKMRFIISVDCASICRKFIEPVKTEAFHMTPNTQEATEDHEDEEAVSIMICFSLQSPPGGDSSAEVCLTETHKAGKKELSDQFNSFPSTWNRKSCIHFNSDTVKTACFSSRAERTSGGTVSQMNWSRKPKGCKYSS